MTINWSERATLILFFLIMTIGFLFWVGGIFLFWLLLRVVGISTDLWAMIGTLSTAVAAAAVLSAGYVAYRELSEIASSRHMEMADRLFEELNSEKNIDARRWVFMNLPDDPKQGVQTMTDEGRVAVKRVLNSLDRVAFLTQSGWIPDELIIPWMHPMIVKSWDKLEPYVMYERERRKEPYFYEHAGELAKRCRAWRAKNLPEAQVIWVDDGL